MKTTKPVEQDQILQVTIENLGKKGDGIARITNDRFVIIIPKTEPNKQYVIKITRLFDKFAIAEKLTEIEQKQKGE